MRFIRAATLAMSALAAGTTAGPDPAPCAAGVRQLAVARVERMPNIPEPFGVRDWKKVAVGFDRLAFDPNATGQYLPLVWLVREHGASQPVAFGLPSYVGDYRRDGAGRRLHEAITCLGAVLGATLAGVDKTAGPYDWVRLCRSYYDRGREGLVLNRLDARSGGSFWYDIFPHILYYALAERYPARTDAARIVPRTARRWRAAVAAMKGPDGLCDFRHSGFDFRRMKPVDNGRFVQPDAAGGIAWLLYAAYQRWKDPADLAAARDCLDFLQRTEKNPAYEVLLPFGACTAARMNAEHGTRYDVGRIVNWCFDRSSARPDWMVIADRWAGVDCHGLAGAVNRPPHRPAGGGYAFAMNTFVMAWPLVPLVRYDARFARAVGKWMLNAASAARLFYPDAHPPERQSCPHWRGDPHATIAYEGLRHHWDGEEELFASGDPVRYKWGPKTDLAVYGSAFAGIFGGIIARTDDPHILRLDLLATDFYRPRAYPTFLYYNPHDRPATVRLDVGERPRDLYDCLAGRFVARRARGRARIALPADGAAVIVLTPAGGRAVRAGGRLLVDGVVVDYRAR